MSCCISNINGIAGGIPSSFQPFSDEIVFAGQTVGNVNTAGNNVYTTASGIALTFTGQNTGGGATNFDITAAGLRCVLNNVNTMWTEATQTGPGIWIPLASLYTAYASRGMDASCGIYFRIYYSTFNMVANTVAPAGGHLAIWGVAGSPSNSANRYAAIVRTNQVGVPVAFGREGGATLSNYTTAPANTASVFGVNLVGGNVQFLGGVWGGSWASSQMVMECNVADGTASTNSSYRDQNNRLAVTFSSGTIAATGNTWVVERIRWDVVPAQMAA